MEDLGRLSLEEYKRSKKLPITIVLEDVRSGHNVGSVFRTADAFGIEKVLLCGITAKPPQRDILKSALGATETVAWEYHDQTSAAIANLKELGYVCLSVEQTQHSIELDSWEWDGKPIALILGNEVRGVSQEIVSASDGCIEIDQFGTKHSLNVSVCAGIVMHRISYLVRSAD